MQPIPIGVDDFRKLRLLERRYGEKVVLLIDEYDTPIHAGFLNGYAKEALTFFRAFLGAGLKGFGAEAPQATAAPSVEKGNPHLFKAVMMGILRVSKESIFSDLNSLDVYTLLHQKFSTAFGFTEAEVVALLGDANLTEKLEVARRWYNGYLFGGSVIYNPWSILSFVNRAGEAARYWVGTSANDLIREALVEHAPRVTEAIETLLKGGAVERRVHENVVLSDLSESEDTLFNLLVFSGYLKAERVASSPDEDKRYRLSIPNLEVRDVFARTFRGWMEKHLRTRGATIDALTRALLTGDADALAEQLERVFESVVSFHDLGRTPEIAYHMFVLGLLTVMEPDYEVRSNRESGHGRPDMMIRPKRAGAPGALLELKIVRPRERSPKRALQEGINQLASNDYAAELLASGAAPIFSFAVAFDGKRVWVRRFDGKTAAKREAKPRASKRKRRESKA